MRNVLSIFIFLWVSTAWCQTKKIKIEKEKEAKTEYYNASSVDLVYGQKVFARNFYRQLNTFDSLKYGLPLKFAGLGFSTDQVCVGARNNINLCMYFNFILPEQIRINDSINGRVNGFIYNLGWGKNIGTRKRTLSCAFYVGFNTGVIKVKSSELGHQVNPLFSPKIAIQPKVRIKNITFSLIFDCEYDVTDPAWRSFGSAEQSRKVNAFTQTGLSVLGTVGYTFL